VEVPISTVIAVNGKGGTGKSSISAFLVAHIAAKKLGSVLAIDADPNSCLADNMGVKGPETIAGICEHTSKNLSKIPAGVTKDRFIEMRIQEAVNEGDGFDLLVMGRPEGPGCYCYVNNLLRGIIGNITKNYDFVIIDNAAGMEHISRRMTAELNKLLIVSDYSIPGVRSAGRIYDLAKELKIRINGAYLIINKVSGPLAPLTGEITKTGLDIAGSVPYDEEMVAWNISSKPIFDFEDETLRGGIEEIFKNIMR
jgi:CO dehydrogenase maturation factor